MRTTYNHADHAFKYAIGEEVRVKYGFGKDIRDNSEFVELGPVLKVIKREERKINNPKYQLSDGTWWDERYLVNKARVAAYEAEDIKIYDHNYVDGSDAFNQEFPKPM